MRYLNFTVLTSTAKPQDFHSTELSCNKVFYSFLHSHLCVKLRKFEFSLFSKKIIIMPRLSEEGRYMGWILARTPNRNVILTFSWQQECADGVPNNIYIVSLQQLCNLALKTYFKNRWRIHFGCGGRATIDDKQKQYLYTEVIRSVEIRALEVLKHTFLAVSSDNYWGV